MEASKTISIDEEDEDFPETNLSNQELTNKNKQNGLTEQKGFLSKVYDFFNYKPIDELPNQRIRGKEI